MPSLHVIEGCCGDNFDSSRTRHFFIPENEQFCSVSSFFTFVVASLRKHLIGKLHVVMTVLMISRDFLVILNGHFWNVSEERSSVEFCSQEFVVMTINAFSYSHSCSPVVKP